MNQLSFAKENQQTRFRSIFRKIQHRRYQRNMKRFIALTLDGKVINCPMIIEPIADQMRIRGNFTLEQAAYISDWFNARK
jgi:preprotein translocase subunit SecD